MFPTNTRSSYSSWVEQKPLNYQAPHDPQALVLAKASQFCAVVGSLGSRLPANVKLDQALLVKALTKHLANNPSETDPYKIKFKIDPRTGNILLKHAKLKFGTSSTNEAGAQSFSWALVPSNPIKQIVLKNGYLFEGQWAEVQFSDSSRPNMPIFVKGKVTLPNRWEQEGKFSFIPELGESRLVAGKITDPDGTLFQEGTWTFDPEDIRDGGTANQAIRQAQRFERIDHFLRVSAQMLGKDFMSAQDMGNFLEAFHAELREESPFAGFEHAIKTTQPDRLPTADRLQNALEITLRSNPEAKPYFARLMLGKLIDRPIQDVIDRMVPRLGDPCMVLLRALNTADQAGQIKTDTYLDTNQLQQLTNLLIDVRNAAPGDHGQTGEIEQFIEHLNNKRNQMLLVQADILGFRRLPEQAHSDRDVTTAAVLRNGLALEFASEVLRGDHDVVMNAVQTDGEALEFASNELRANREVVMAAVQNFAWALAFASNELNDNLEIVMTAVEQDGWSLQFASDRLKDDRGVVMAAVQHRGEAIQFASEALQHDHDVLRAANR